MSVENTAISSVNVSYGPAAVVAAKPILPSQRKAAGPSTGQHSLNIARTREKQAAIDGDLNMFFSHAKNLSNEMAQKYGNKPDYYLRLMFSGGASMLKARQPSAFNAWAHSLAKDANEDADPGEATNLLDLQREHLDEYHNLSRTEKRELVESFKEVRTSRTMGFRVNPRGRQADVNSTFEKIENMIIGLKCRVGIDGFYCFFKNNSEFQMRPRWFFTAPQLNRYFTGQIRRWDVESIGALGEAFSIAGCDLMGYLRNAKARSDWLKNEIRDKITTALVKITGNKKAIMQYKSYDKDIVLHYGIELFGWTEGLPFACPSSLPTTLEPLQKLLQAIDDGECGFRRLSSSERAARRETFNQKLAEGTVPARAPRKDKGKKRATYRRRKPVESGSNDNDANGDDHDEEEEEEEEEGVGRGKKRVRRGDDE
ncbi:hypothetical protein K466DRAFT_606777 [Polyporus arcularius HHB13444]|uniref:Uncharacterized protein n=1 Tax=Polyporus arcularius HHB13444 TaxID=1314778 RepID=A0A5C3NRT1_9APHY|nr:hypothetical protein K466DRAFT_606777 [Polyporus arcularius HHB13444]